MNMMTFTAGSTRAGIAKCTAKPAADSVKRCAQELGSRARQHCRLDDANRQKAVTQGVQAVRW